MGTIGGFKKTDVGLVPEDWEVSPLGPRVKITSGESPSSFRFGTHETPYFKVEQLGWDSKYLSRTPYRIDSPRCVPAGSIIFAKRGAAIRLNRVRILAQDSFMDTNMMALTPDQSLSNEFLHYALCHRNLWEVADTTSIPQINNKHINPLLLAFPPTIKEQQAIAEALSDADALIESLEQLIAKKRLLKQGVMQELLTGKRRLPGFEGTWGSFTFHEVFRRINAKEFQVLASDYQASGDFPVVDQGQKYVVGHTDRMDKVFRCPAQGVIVFGDHTCIVKFVDFDFAVGADGTQILATRSEHDCRFYAFQLQVNPIASTGYNRHFKFLLERSYRAPHSKDEQSAISGAIADLEREIMGLAAQITKARLVKHGMTQQLLTGRIRLV